MVSFLLYNKYIEAKMGQYFPIFIRKLSLSIFTQQKAHLPMSFLFN